MGMVSGYCFDHFLFCTEHLNSQFVQFLLDVIEDGLPSDTTDQLPDLFINVLLAFNLHIPGVNLHISGSFPERMPLLSLSSSPPQTLPCNNSFILHKRGRLSFVFSGTPKTPKQHWTKQRVIEIARKGYMKETWNLCVPFFLKHESLCCLFHQSPNVTWIRWKRVFLKSWVFHVDTNTNP